MHTLHKRAIGLLVALTAITIGVLAFSATAPQSVNAASNDCLVITAATKATYYSVPCNKTSVSHVQGKAVTSTNNGRTFSFHAYNHATTNAKCTKTIDTVLKTVADSCTGTSASIDFKGLDLLPAPVDRSTLMNPGDCVSAGYQWDYTNDRCVPKTSTSTGNTSGSGTATAVVGGDAWSVIDDKDQCVKAKGSWETIDGVSVCVGPDTTDTSLCSDIPLGIRWLACPVTELLQVAVDAIDQIIKQLLTYDAKVFEDGSGYYNAWSAFRTIALALIVIAAVVVVIAQAVGMQMLDAYTVKKALPRLFVAVIGISLSWPLMELIVVFINDIGSWTEGIIAAPFSGVGGSGWESAGMILINLGAGAFITWVVMAAAAATITGGGLIIGSFLLVGLVGVIIGLIVIGLRTIIITFCVITAPLAIACIVLPATSKIFEFWRKTFTTALIVFPIIMGLLAIGKVGAAVSTNPIMSIIVYFAPYFAIPFAFQMAGGVLGKLSGMANDAERGFLDRQKKKRQGMYTDMGSSFKRGEAFKRNSRFARPLNRAGVAMGTGLRGNFGRGDAGAIAEAQQFMGHAAELDKHPAITPLLENDDANHALVRLGAGMNEKQAIESLMLKGDKWNRDRAEKAVAAVKATGIDDHGRAASIWAAKRLAATGTGYNDVEDVIATGHIATQGLSAEAGAAVANDIGGAVNFLAKQKGNNDIAIGAGNLASRIASGKGGSFAGADGVLAEDRVSYEERQAAIGSMSVYQWGSLKRRGFDKATEHIKNGLEAKAGDIVTKADGTSFTLTHGQAVERRQNAAIQMLEMQRAVLNGATGENQVAINKFLAENGVSVGAGNIERQIIAAASNGMGGAVISEADLVGRARVYDQNEAARRASGGDSGP